MPSLIAVVHPSHLPTRLSPFDLALVALYLVAITLFGLRFRKSGKQRGSSLKSYFLADNIIPWWAIALSIVSAETSTLTIISIPGVAFAGDFGFLQIVLGYMLGRVVVAVLFLPKYFRGEMLTAYQLIDRRFGHTLHKVTAGLFLLTRAAAEGVRVFAISIVVGIAIGTGDTLSIAIISALTLLYTFEGGMAAVIWTDVVQMALYVAGTLVALFTLSHSIPGGWQHIHAVAAPLGKFHMFNFALNLTTTYTFWAGVLGGTFLTMASHGTDQLMVQRMLAARNLRESRLALLSSGVVIFLQFALFLLIGVGLFVFYGNHPQVFTSPDRIFPTFIVQQMPRGVAGLLVAAILAAAMSNLSAALNSLASTTVVDFYLPFRTSREASRFRDKKFKDEQEEVILSEARSAQSKDPESLSPAPAARTVQPQSSTTSISRLATVFWAVVLFAIAVYAIQHGGKGHVVETGLSIASVAYGCLLGVFLLGTLTRYATQSGAIAGMICGFALNLYLWKFTSVAFTWYVLIGALVTFAIGSLFSLVLRKPRRTSIATAAVFVCVCFLGVPFSSAAQKPASALASFASFAAPPSRPLRSAFAVASPTTYDFSPVSTLITTAIAQHKLPGAVVLIGHNGKIVFEHAYGERKLAGEPGLDGKPSPAEPMTEDTLFDMASLTKVLVTTTAILQLYEQHKLDLDTPVAHYLPEFAATTSNPPPDLSSTTEHSLSSFAAGGGPASASVSPQTRAWKSRITIRELLTHYSGLPEDVNLKDAWGLAAPDKAEGIRRAMASVPYGPPGLTFKYSDINFITLGALVEKLSGEVLDQYAEKQIFRPLAMYETRYHAWCSCFQGSFPPYGHEPSGYQPLRPMSEERQACFANPCEAFDPATDRRTAPTAHDNEGTPATNPDFGHLLRGTVHDPTARRMGGVAGHAGVFSTAEDVSRFCDALLAKLLHNTGPFPLRQSTLQLATSPQAPPTAVDTATIFTQSGEPTHGVAQRGLGWDLNSPFSRPRGSIFPITTKQHPGSFGHTGFTGTSLWTDPVSNTYVILLANSVHPHVIANISPLRGAVATAAAQALGLAPPDALSSAAAASTALSSFRKAGGPASLPSQSITQDVPRLDSEVRPSSEARPPSSAQTGSQARSNEAAKAELKASYKQFLEISCCGIISDQDVQKFRPPTLTGIDVLEQTRFAALKALAKAHDGHLRIGLLTNQSGLDRNGNRTIDILLHASPEITLTTLFSPEHGLYGRQDKEHLQKEEDPVTHLPVIGLYGPKSYDKHPKQSDLRQLDALVIDLQDAGVRFWTYETLVGYVLEAAAKARIDVILLDRPNPIGGLATQGETSDPGFESTYTDFMPIPLRHGLTLGELARFFNANATEVQLDPRLLDAEATDIGTPTPGLQPPATQPGLHAQLTVIPMQNWTRNEFFADTHLPWTPPSPNLRTPRASVLYPALGLAEQTNISVGRGTATPFENLGAPYINAAELAAYLTRRNIPGVRITPSTMTIADDTNHYPFHGQTIPALHFEVTDRTALDSPELGIELLAALHHLYPKEFQLARAKNLMANAATLAALTRGDDPRTIASSWTPALQSFRMQARPFLLYP